MLKSICRTYTHLIKPNASTINNQIIRLTAFKSAVSLESIYPHSTLKLTTPEKPTSAANTDFTGFIPIDQIEITYSRSSGPGGQNVNTVNTKVDLRFHLQKAGWLSDDIKSKLLHKFKTKITKGYLVFRSELTRSQQLNLADCLEKARSAIRSVIMKPVEANVDSLEKIRRRQERAASERLLVKRQRSQIKSDRAAPIM